MMYSKPADFCLLLKYDISWVKFTHSFEVSWNASGVMLPRWWTTLTTSSRLSSSEKEDLFTGIYRFRFLGLIGVDSSIFCLIFQSRHNSWKSLSRSSQSESVSQSVSGDEGAGVTIPGTDQSQPQWSRHLHMYSTLQRPENRDCDHQDQCTAWVKQNINLIQGV